MSTPFAIATFIGSLGLTIASSLVLAVSVERIGARLGLAEGLQGIVTALAADAPEIASAVVAIGTGRHDLGVGVVFGSGVFNLAGLLGLSAVIGRGIKIGPRGLLFNGLPSLAVATVGAALATRMLGAVPAVALIGAIMVPYGLLSALHPPRGHRHPPLKEGGNPVVHRHPPGTHERAAERHGAAMPFEELAALGRVRLALRNAISDSAVAARRDKPPAHASWDQMLAVIPSLTAVVVGSIGMVRAAETLGNRWGISEVILGALIIATLTGLPNVLASVRLAVRGRGSAVVSESLNSNTLNVVAGAALPALVVGVLARAGPTSLEAWWLVGMTGGVLGLGFHGRGISRVEGFGVIAVYALFSATLLLLT